MWKMTSIANGMTKAKLSVARTRKSDDNCLQINICFAKINVDRYVNVDIAALANNVAPQDLCSVHACLHLGYQKTVTTSFCHSESDVLFHLVSVCTGETILSRAIIQPL